MCVPFTEIGNRGKGHIWKKTFLDTFAFKSLLKHPSGNVRPTFRYICLEFRKDKDLARPGISIGREEMA